MISKRVLTALLAGVLGLAASASAPMIARAQALPPPRPLVSGLDLECYRTAGPAPNITLSLTQLNPVLLQLGLPTHQVVVRELVQTCVPVRKNNAIPAPGALPFIRNIDFACYRVDAAPLANPIPLNLTHLNPVLANLPPHDVRLRQPAQLCLPIAKNGVLPPPAILNLVQFIDLECYNVDAATHPVFTVGPTQLNPQLTAIAPHPMTLASAPRQVCVPVRKNQQAIPPAVLNIVRWIDLEKFAAAPVVTINPPVDVELNHINPLLVNLPPVKVTLQHAEALLVPVAKNGVFPPAD